jgi:hypothetical protein
MTQKNNFMHPAAKMYAQEVKDGKLDRREFLSRATALGVTTVAAYGLLGLDTPAQAGAASFLKAFFSIFTEIFSVDFGDDLSIKSPSATFVDSKMISFDLLSAVGTISCFLLYVI